MKKLAIGMALIATVCLLAFLALEFSPPKTLEETTASEKMLLLDDRVVDRVENAVLRVGKVQKHPSNPLFGEDKPWGNPSAF